jgi:large subunit ribosomal protein L7/L12
MAEIEKIEVPAKFADLVKKIEEMSVLDLAELVKILEKKFGVSAAAPVMAAGAPAGAAASDVEEKTSFSVVLVATGDKKIEVIKVVRDITQKGLKESKDLVDAAATAPQVVKENAKKEEAEDMKKKFEAAGAKVELK